jgi:hypothetical protein
MGVRIVASCSLQAPGMVFQNGCVFCMDWAPDAVPSEYLESFQHFAVAGRRQIARRVAHEAFEADNACFDERLNVTEARSVCKRMPENASRRQIGWRDIA